MPTLDELVARIQSQQNYTREQFYSYLCIPAQDFHIYEDSPHDTPSFYTPEKLNMGDHYDRLFVYQDFRGLIWAFKNVIVAGCYPRFSGAEPYTENFWEVFVKADEKTFKFYTQEEFLSTLKHTEECCRKMNGMPRCQL